MYCLLILTKTFLSQKWNILPYLLYKICLLLYCLTHSLFWKMLYLIFSSTYKFSQLITYFRHNIPEHTMIAYMIRCRKSCGGQITWLFVALSLANQDHVYCQWQRVVYQCFDRREFSKKTHTHTQTTTHFVSKFMLKQRNPYLHTCIISLLVVI